MEAYSTREPSAGVYRWTSATPVCLKKKPVTHHFDETMDVDVGLLLSRWRARTGETATHLVLTGGKLHVPDRLHGEFLAGYANAVAGGARPAIVERRTRVFKLFLDLDFHEPLPDETVIRGAACAACAVASEWFDSADAASVVVLRKFPGEVPSKIGVHLVWPGVRATAETALGFRDHLVRRLAEGVPDAARWDEVVDAAVFKGSGLRMPWASKAAADADVYYVPAATLTCRDDGEVTWADHPWNRTWTASEIREWVRRLSIRSGFVPGDDVPTALTADAAAHHDSQDPGVEALSSFVPKVPVGGNDDLEAVEALRRLVPAAYGTDHRFSSAHRLGNDGGTLVLRSTSRRCANKHFQEHASSNVYFVVTRRGVMYQRCYSRKDAAAPATATGQPCSTFASPPWEVPRELLDRLFPPNREKPKGATTTTTTTPDLDAILRTTRPVLKRTCRGPKGRKGS
jgi:hypothetical protein